MKKQTKAQQAIKDLTSAQMRWEFLRRGDRYIEAFQKWIEKYPDWEGFNPAWLVRKSAERGESVRHPEVNSFIDRLCKDRDEFRTTWGIEPTDPISPHSPFLREQDIWIVDFGHATASWRSSPDVITLCIDVRGPIRDLLQYLEWRIAYEKQQNNAQNRKPPKKFFEEYKRYLSVFDLMKAGMSRKEIADKVFPGYKGDVEQMISNCMSKANRLILQVQKGIW